MRLALSSPPAKNTLIKKMRGLNKFNASYFEKYRTTPVHIRPFSSKQTRIAKKIIATLRKQLTEFKIFYLVRGSTAFKISGKGEVEVGVYPHPVDWQPVLDALARYYGPPENLEDHYARFNTSVEDREVEIIILKEHEAEIDINLHRYLLSHPKLLQDYEMIKQQFSFSKREYMKAKNKFLSHVIDLI